MSNEMMRREMKEALDAGERALSSLRKAQEKLNNAGNWGLFGLIWTGVAAMIAFMNYKNGFSDEGVATHEIVLVELQSED